MSSLREVKDRIASVRSTLKITSAMKLVASSKLRKAQRSIEALRPYSDTLKGILAAVAVPATTIPRPLGVQGDSSTTAAAVVLAFASNSSMCGAFNANVIKKTLAVVKDVEGPVELWTFGRKVAEGMRKAGYPASRDFMHLVSHPEFDKVAEVASELRGLRSKGEIWDVILVYNRFISTGRQEIVAEHWGASLPYGEPAETDIDSDAGYLERQDSGVNGDYILEPSRKSLLESLAPQVEDLQLYAALLDSVASEHAARMVAMQAATDNAETLLGELTLEYNKGRQQKITSEILDLVSGSEV